MKQKYKSTMAVVVILNFIKSTMYWTTVILVWPISVCTPNLTQIIMFICNWDVAKNPNSKWRPPPSWILPKLWFWLYSNLCIANILSVSIPPPSWIFTKVIFGPPSPFYGEYLSANQIWCKSVQKSLRYTCLCIFEMADVRHLGFNLPYILDCLWCSPWWAKWSLLIALWSVQMRLRCCDFTTLQIWLENDYMHQF